MARVSAGSSITHCSDWLNMVHIGISLDSGTCHALAERAEENGFGDVTLRQAIEIYLDATASVIVDGVSE